MSCCASGLEHRALLFADDGEFVAEVAPYVREAVERDEPIVVVVADARAAALREALGAAAEPVRFERQTEWYETAPRALSRYASWVEERRGAPRMRVVGEMPFPDPSVDGARDWLRIEAVTNAALADRPVDMMCPYSLALPDWVLDQARLAHPLLCEGGRAVANPEVADPLAFLRALDAPLPPAPPGAAEVAFEGDPSVARRFVADVGRRAGLAAERVEELGLVASELATNAILHGRAPRRLRAWLDGSRVVCEVTDGGAGVESPLAGFLMPDVEAPGGRGLWISRQLCDRLEVRGASVRFEVGV